MDQGTLRQRADCWGWEPVSYTHLTYARRLVQATLKYGNASYQEKVSVFYDMPYLIMIFSIVMMIVVMGLTRLLAAALVSPMMKMAHNARKIARNDFSGQDLTVPNRDEMGELVKAFNKIDVYKRQPTQ